jgi:hypothetical protein
MAAERAVAVERERDVAVRAAARDAARAAVDRGRDAPPVQEEDRAAARVGDAAERLEERRRKRIPGLAAEVDERTDGRRADPRAERQPREPRPALGPRRRGAVHGDRALERRALRGDGARVVARVGLLLVRRVVLLVDDDQPDAAHRREDAERAPTTIRASRARSGRARRARSASPSDEWQRSRRGRRTGGRKRPTVCGASAISGTSTIVPRPRSSAAAQAWR